MKNNHAARFPMDYPEPTLESCMKIQRKQALTVT